MPIDVYPVPILPLDAVTWLLSSAHGSTRFRVLETTTTHVTARLGRTLIRITPDATSTRADLWRFPPTRSPGDTDDLIAHTLLTNPPTDTVTLPASLEVRLPVSIYADKVGIDVNPDDCPHPTTREQLATWLTALYQGVITATHARGHQLP